MNDPQLRLQPDLLATAGVAALVGATFARVLVGSPPLPIVLGIAAFTSLAVCVNRADTQPPAGGLPPAGHAQRPPAPAPATGGAEATHDWIRTLGAPPTSAHRAAPLVATPFDLLQHRSEPRPALVCCPRCGEPAEVAASPSPTCGWCGHTWRPSRSLRVRVDPRVGPSDTVLHAHP